jgi:cystatin-A/B
MMVGGYGEVKEATDEIRALCEEIRSDTETKIGKTFGIWEPVCYKTQVVAGTNYRIKIRVSDNEFVHIKVHKPLPNTGNPCEVKEMTEGHNESEEL